MDKATEIQIMRDAIAKLGQDSYCGPWLSDMLPSIERDITSDIPPYITLADCQARQEHDIKMAKFAAGEIVARAEEKAQDIMEKARQDIIAMKERARQYMRQAMVEIG